MHRGNNKNSLTKLYIQSHILTRILDWKYMYDSKRIATLMQSTSNMTQPQQFIISNFNDMFIVKANERLVPISLAFQIKSLHTIKSVRINSFIYKSYKYFKSCFLYNTYQKANILPYIDVVSPVAEYKINIYTAKSDIIVSYGTIIDQKSATPLVMLYIDRKKLIKLVEDATTSDITIDLMKLNPIVVILNKVKDTKYKELFKRINTEIIPTLDEVGIPIMYTNEMPLIGNLNGISYPVQLEKDGATNTIEEMLRNKAKNSIKKYVPTIEGLKLFYNNI